MPTSYDENKNLTYSGGLLPENGDKNTILNISGDTCVESALGACMLVKTSEINDFGLFDENFFLYFSDDDLCRKIKKSNKSIIQVFDARCSHKHGNIKVKNKFYKLFIREYNFTYDRLYYFFKDNKHQELVDFYKKKTFLYFFKIIIKLISLNLLEVTRLVSILCGYYHFYLKFYLNRNDK